VELRAYGAIIKRRLWIIVLIVGVVSLYAAYQYYALDKTSGAFQSYQSSVTIRIGLQAVARAVNNSSADYLNTSDLLSDAFVNSQVINSKEFATQVAAQVQADMDQITSRGGARPKLGNVQDLTAISAALSTLRSHNLVTINVVWSTSDGARAIANATGEVCSKNIGAYLDYVVRDKATLAENNTPPKMAAEVITKPTGPIVVSGPSLNRLQLLLALILVAVVIGVALAFLIEYLDDRIHSREEVEELLQLPIYGEVPSAALSNGSKAQHIRQLSTL